MELASTTTLPRTCLGAMDDADDGSPPEGDDDQERNATMRPSLSTNIKRPPAFLAVALAANTMLRKEADGYFLLSDKQE